MILHQSKLLWNCILRYYILKKIMGMVHMEDEACVRMRHRRRKKIAYHNIRPNLNWEECRDPDPHIPSRISP